MKKEKFEYDIDFGAIMDYVDNRFLLVIKDEKWTDYELSLLTQMDLNFCYTQDIAIFVLEGGSIDSSDFYFNVQDCDWKESLLNSELVDIEVNLVDKENDICWKKKKTLNKAQSRTILDLLEKQSKVEFMPNEYDVNVEGLQSAYEPFELLKFSKLAIKF
ncbi:MAG: hypothetical protein KBT48_00870 [Firmicutes bacterium]|nr:hypothetical protein [Bacillota bacterium]